MVHEWKGCPKQAKTLSPWFWQLWYCYVAFVLESSKTLVEATRITTYRRQYSAWLHRISNKSCFHILMLMINHICHDQNTRPFIPRCYMHHHLLTYLKSCRHNVLVVANAQGRFNHMLSDHKPSFTSQHNKQQHHSHWVYRKLWCLHVTVLRIWTLERFQLSSQEHICMACLCSMQIVL